MSLTRTLSVSFVLFLQSGLVSTAQQAEVPVGDAARGKIVYRSVGYCGNCHGWSGDGETGIMLQAPRGGNLRQSALDTETLIEVVKCGLPGTPMPYHGRAAYRDEPCYGLVLTDFEAGNQPVRGKTFSNQDILNLVAYLQAKVIGLGEATFEECTDFYDNPAASACRSLQ